MKLDLNFKQNSKSMNVHFSESEIFFKNIFSESGNVPNDKDGVSITKAEINNKGELIITLSDNSISNLGVVVGTNGANGLTPYINAAGNWQIGEEDTGIKAVGTDGQNGNDGATPEIKDGYWYINNQSTGVKALGVDGKDGIDGKDGYMPIKGVDYFDGKDGISVTHEWDGTKLKVTSASGTSSADLQGEQGKSAYEYAQQYGFTGTEEEFGRLMSLISEVDQIGNIEDYWQYNEQTKDLVTAINQNADYVNKNFEKNENKSQVIQGDSESEIKYPSVKAVYDLGQDITGTINTRVKTFHASINNANFQYVKGSADFTYQDVINTENCQIEVSIANEKIYLKKQEFKNINPPDPIAGRYVGFSEMIRVAGEMAELFLFVYDKENLPTDEVSVDRLKDWGDYQYCVSSYQPIVMGNFLDTDISAERNNNTNAPSTKAAGDYTDKQCGVVLDYMQTTFAQNIMTLVNQRFGPHIIYDDPTGFEASNDDAGDTWHLTGLNLSQYKRIKCYVCSGGDGDANYSPEHIVEVYLDDRAKGSFGYFSASHTGHNPNNRNRYHIATFTVNAEKTAIQFQHSISIYGTSASNSSGGRKCYLIEGYVL